MENNSDQQVWVWGANSHGQLGDNTTIDSLFPKLILVEGKIHSIGGGGGHTFAVSANDEVIPNNCKIN
jgi:alpha-tubulin suppressor-like RCC1 family protein